MQVVKDPLKTKGARLSMDLTIAGRYMVYTPTGEGIGVSRRLEDAERERLPGAETKGLDLRRRRGNFAPPRTAPSRADFERELPLPVQAPTRCWKSASRPPRERRRSSSRRRTFPVRVVRDIFSEPFRARGGRRPRPAPPAGPPSSPDRPRARGAGRALPGRAAALRRLQGQSGDRLAARRAASISRAAAT